MKPVSTNIQKKILFIPFINQLIGLFWLYNFIVMRRPLLDLIKSAGMLWISFVPILLLAKLLCTAVPYIETVVTLVVQYLAPVLFGICIIKYQDAHP